MAGYDPRMPTDDQPDDELPLEEWTYLGEEQREKLRQMHHTFILALAPWLFDFGSWLFGGLIAFSIVAIQSPIFMASADRDAAMIISACAYALALPLDIAGLCLLRLIQGIKQHNVEEEMQRTLQDVRYPGGQQAAPGDAFEQQRQRRTYNVIVSASWLSGLALLLTLLGLAASLWHIAWWIAIAFLLVALVSALLVTLMISAPPPQSKAERAAQRQRRAALARRLRAQGKQEAQRQRRAAVARSIDEQSRRWPEEE